MEHQRPITLEAIRELVDSLNSRIQSTQVDNPIYYELRYATGVMEIAFCEFSVYSEDTDDDVETLGELFSVVMRRTAELIRLMVRFFDRIQKVPLSVGDADDLIVKLKNECIPSNTDKPA